MDFDVEGAAQRFMARRIGMDTIEVAVGHYMPTRRRENGGDADAIGVWTEKGVLGTQLGPNKYGRKW
jgi:Icc protein